MNMEYTVNDFAKVEPIYTGGGIYIFTGELTDGTFFMAESSVFDVRILNDDPSRVTWENAMFKEYTMDSVEWQEEHLVKDLEPSEAKAFHLGMLTWVQRNAPSGNYNMGDIDDLYEEVKALEGNWR